MELCGEEEPASIPVNTMPINESAPNVEQSHIQWGLHDNKPKSQAVFEQAVESAANIIAEYHPYLPEPPEIMWAVEAANWQDGCQGKDYRPRIYDGESKRWILNDSGAMISVLPKKEYPEAKFDPDVTIEAVNKSKICTYGRKQIQIRIGRKVYNHEVIIADVSQPVLGWDFNRKFHLSLIWTDMGDLELHDRKAGTRSPMQVTANVHTQWPNLSGYKLVIKGQPQKAPLTIGALQTEYKTFQQWSQGQKIAATKEEPVHSVPTHYRQLINKYPSILKADFHAATVKHGVEHKIETGDSIPCQAKVRPLMPGSPKAIQGEKDWRELEELGILEKVNPQDSNIWTSALHLAAKPDGTLRVCGDFRELNQKTLMDGFPLPNIRHFMGQIRGSTVFSKIDLKKAYHQIPLEKESRKKTTVITQWGAWQFTRLPMGLKNSAQSFQRLMTHVLGDIPGLFVYMDDVLVYSKNEAEHLKTIEEMFKRLDKAGLAISESKCIFGVTELNFLGYRVSKDGITPLPKKLEAIVEFKSPQKQKILLGYLGAINYYRRCLPNLKVGEKTLKPAEILQPLYNAATIKLPPKKKFTEYWVENGLEESFKRSKEMLMQATMLTHPDPACPLAITTDASEEAIGGVLEQFQDGSWRPLGFWSRTLKADKQKWTTFRRELYAVQQGIRHFMTEIESRNLTVYTDHKPLLGAFKSPVVQPHDPIAANQIHEVCNWTQDIRYLQGKSNFVADLLSRPNAPMGAAYRMPSAEQEVASMETLTLETVSHKALAEAQKTCPEVKGHRLGQRPKSVRMEDIEFSPSVTLYCEMSEGQKARPLVPKEFRQNVIKLCHQLVHPGQKETVKKVAERYYWKALRADVSEFVSKCQPCQATKPFKTIRPTMGHIPVPDQRFTSLQADIVGPLPVSEGKRYLLTIFDRTSRWLEALPLAEANAMTCCQEFIRQWISRFGLPQTITSDNGNTFIAQIWKEMHAQLGIEVAYTPPYHSSSLGGGGEAA